MKKFHFIILLSFAFFLQSCKIDSDITYHKDAATTTITNINFKEFMDYMGEMESDSVKGNRTMKGFDKFPKNWKSLYEINKQENEEMPSDEDSLKFFKKTFLKSYAVDGEKVGISIKMDRLNKEDWKKMSAKNNRNSGMLTSSIENYEWDGKRLIIDTDKFKMNELGNAFKGGGEKDKMNDKETAAFLEMMGLTMKSTLHFESKIKKMEGKHDFVKQIDKKTVEIDVDYDALWSDENQLKHQDKKVIIYVK